MVTFPKTFVNVGRDFCKDKPIVKCQRHKTARRTSYKRGTNLCMTY
jgi:hypothetical protein